MIDFSILPTVNAILNGTALVLLVLGYQKIKQGYEVSHKRFMLAAFGVSILFLISYVTYHTLGEERKFGGTGIIRPIYFFILITHVILAAIVPLLASRTLYLGLKGRFDQHRKIARITFPIWIYVSVTGILVYLMLYVIFKPADGSVV